MVKISYVEITARSDFPTVGRKDLHLWEPTLQTLARQTMKNFEYIIVDIFYDERPNYFKEHNYGLRIKHVPSAPNIWKDLGIPHPCHQINKGFIHADGELIYINGDSFMYPPNFMECLWKHYKEGYFATALFGGDITYAEIESLPTVRNGFNHAFNKPEYKVLKEEVLKLIGTHRHYNEVLSDWKKHHPTWRKDWLDQVLEWLQVKGHINIKDDWITRLWTGKQLTTSECGFPTEWYRFLGFQGLINMDDRYNLYFKNNNREMAVIAPNQYYTGALSLEAALKVNGFDQNFDGDGPLADCDMGIRLDMAGYKLALFRDVYCIEAYAELAWHPKMRRPGIKCNYALLRYNQLMKRFRANEPLLESDIEWMIKNICLTDTCPPPPCKEVNGDLYPFWHKKEKELYEYWKKNQAPMKIDLKLEREIRINGDDYMEGTYVNI